MNVLYILFIVLVGDRRRMIGIWDNEITVKDLVNKFNEDTDDPIVDYYCYEIFELNKILKDDFYWD